MGKPHRVSEVFRKDMRFRSTDPYRHPAKYPSDTWCPECGLVFRNGIWKRATSKPSEKTHLNHCPACLQIRDGYAGGILHLGGNFLERHREEILLRIRKLEKQSLEEHPLERIMRIAGNEKEVSVYATAEHLVARIGKALRRDFGGELEIKYARENKFASVRWFRDD